MSAFPTHAEQKTAKGDAIVANYNTPDPVRYSSGSTGLIVGLLAGAVIGYSRYGPKGLALGLLGAIIGSMSETAFVAGRSGRVSLLLALIPILLLVGVAYAVYLFFRRPHSFHF